MHKSQFQKMSLKTGFCAPGSHIIVLFLWGMMSMMKRGEDSLTNIPVATWQNQRRIKTKTPPYIWSLVLWEQQPSLCVWTPLGQGGGTRGNEKTQMVSLYGVQANAWLEMRVYGERVPGWATDCKEARHCLWKNSFKTLNSSSSLHLCCYPKIQI